MKILVCISNVPDTTTKIKFAEGNASIDTTGIQWVINPWDELSLTRALELKDDTSSGVKSVTVLHVGPGDARREFRHSCHLRLQGQDAGQVVSGRCGRCRLAGLAGQHHHHPEGWRTVRQPEGGDLQHARRAGAAVADDRREAA